MQILVLACYLPNVRDYVLLHSTNTKSPKDRSPTKRSPGRKSSAKRSPGKKSPTKRSPTKKVHTLYYLMMSTPKNH